jgi:CRP-like cAMP-binding protein
MKWIEDGLSVEFSLKILDQEYALTGRSTYSKINPQNPKEIINGLCFDEIDDTLQQQLIEHLQELEHIAIQKHQKTETDDIQKLDSFNPMLRSAMTLTQTPAFSNLSLSEAAHFLSSGQISSFKSGDVLIKEGEEGDSFFVLTSGSVEVRTGETLLAQLEAGAAIGEMALIDPAPRTASIRANTGGTLIEITKDSFEESILFGDQISLKVLQSLSETILDRLVLLNTAIRSELQKGEEASLSNFLEEHSNTGSGS